MKSPGALRLDPSRFRSRQEAVREVIAALTTITDRFVASSRTMRWSLAFFRGLYTVAPFLHDWVSRYQTLTFSAYESVLAAVGLYVENEELDMFRRHFAAALDEHKLQLRDYKETRDFDEVQRRIIQRAAEKIVDKYMPKPAAN